MSQDPQSRPSHQQGQQNQGQKQQQRNRKSTEKKEKDQFTLKTVDRVLKWPMVDIAWHESNHVYGKIKDFNVVFTKSFELAEKSYQTVVKMSLPLLMTFEMPISLVDNVLDKGLEKLEAKAPFVKDPPKNIYNNTKEIVMVVVQPPLNCATTILQYSKDQANNILATSYGNWAVTKIDNFSAGAEKLIDRFIHLEGEGEDMKSSVKTPATEDPVMHVVETIGSLFGVVSRRVLVKFLG
ncbi:lipid storage droplets surface-binding protein 2 isoform X2 [Culicoides brevitarsis]|uniref:lipid storage droplets surface-binding protein 2 isoform X2 n=1 Tax=Culicoides brevitarsis TaxID=469753 RepID=UPI00307C7FD0